MKSPRCIVPTGGLHDSIADQILRNPKEQAGMPAVRGSFDSGTRKAMLVAWYVSFGFPEAAVCRYVPVRKSPS